MKTFIFIQTNGSAVVTLSAEDLADAQEELKDIVIMPEGFHVEKEEGEDEEWIHQ